MVKGFFREIKEFFQHSVNSRLFVLGILMFALFFILVQQIFVLQIVRGQDFVDRYSLKSEREREVFGTRGNIYDRNGTLLAYNDLSYAVTLEDSGTYANSRVKNKELNQNILDLVQMIEASGHGIVNEFPIYLTPEGNFEFQVQDNALQRFRADIFGYGPIEDLAKNSNRLGFDEAEATPWQIIDFLRRDQAFGIRIEGIDEQATEDARNFFYAATLEDAYKVLTVRQALSRYAFQRFVPITVAEGIDDVTVARIMENSYRFTGVDIAETTIRNYEDAEYFSHILGYTGPISKEELDALSEENPDYSLQDVVGKAGIEQFMELSLQGGKGWERFYVDNVGRMLEMIEETPAGSGNDLHLSIDRNLQVAAYQLLEQEIAGIVHSKIINEKVFEQGARGAADIKIPIFDVYFQLINNNVIDIRRFQSEDASDTERAVHEAFTDKLASVLERLMEQLRSPSPQSFESLNEEMQVYMEFVLNMLTDRGIWNSVDVDRENPVFLEWEMEQASLAAYLQEGIARGWVNISAFETDSRYSDTGEIYEALLQYIEDRLGQSNAFHKKVYRYLILQDRIRPSQLCLILFDQGVLAPDEGSYSALRGGSLGAFAFLMDKIKNIEITPAQLALDPCTGSSVLMDPRTGELLALVSYPGFDINRLANFMDNAYYNSLLNDLSLPLYSNATMQQTAPGSTFKMVTAAAGLSEDPPFVSTATTFNCKGEFPFVENPKCWLLSGHGDQNIVQAIQHSCNVYFYYLGYHASLRGTGVYNADRGVEFLAKYSEMFGFGERTGIELPESMPRITTEFPVPSAIGQGNFNFATISLARYVAAVANRGDVYKLTLLNKMTDSSGNLIEEFRPETSNSITEVSDYSWNAIQEGMTLMAQDHAAFRGFPAEIGAAGKTGTAQQVETRPNHALFVGYAPCAREPEIAIATRIAYGYTSANAASVSRKILDYHFQLMDAQDLLSGEAATVAGNDAVTD